MPEPFGNLITAMVTPFDRSGEVNFEQAIRLARHLADNNSTALVLCGTTGESPTLTTGEKLELFRIVSDAVGDRIKIIAGTGCNSTFQTEALTAQASETGVHGIMLVTPYYNKPTQEGLLCHFKAAAAATRLPVMLYNIPGRTGVNMNAETTLQLSQVENIIAVKEAAGSLEQAAIICRDAPPGFAVYAGDDAMTLPLLSVGAVGVVSVAAHLVGPRIAEMITNFMNGNHLEAAAIHQRLLPLFSGLFMASNPIPLKSALNMTGVEVGRPRLPLLPLSGKQEAELQRLLADYGLLG